jgi:hypothetical protein
MKILLIIAVAIVVAVALVSVCSRSNNVLLGRVEAKVGSHTVVVTDCYRLQVPKPQHLDDTADGKPSWRFAPCRDAEVLIKGDELVVNGRAYGPLHEGDSITVDHGKVLINEKDAPLRGTP